MKNILKKHTYEGTQAFFRKAGNQFYLPDPYSKYRSGSKKAKSMRIQILDPDLSHAYFYLYLHLLTDYAGTASRTYTVIHS
jgi:hypothetical protein